MKRYQTVLENFSAGWEEEFLAARQGDRVSFRARFWRGHSRVLQDRALFPISGARQDGFFSRAPVAKLES